MASQRSLENIMTDLYLLVGVIIAGTVVYRFCEREFDPLCWVLFLIVLMPLLMFILILWPIFLLIVIWQQNFEKRDREARLKGSRRTYNIAQKTEEKFIPDVRVSREPPSTSEQVMLRPTPTAGVLPHGQYLGNTPDPLEKLQTRNAERRARNLSLGALVPCYTFLFILFVAMDLYVPHAVLASAFISQACGILVARWRLNSLAPFNVMCISKSHKKLVIWSFVVVVSLAILTLSAWKLNLWSVV